MSASPESSQFRMDVRAQITPWTGLQIVLILLIPIALVIFWYHYLRRIGREEEEKRNVQATVQGKPRPAGGAETTCRRCGWRVRAAPGPGVATCPNCMSVL